MKDIPAMGNANFSISTSLTGDSGEAFLAALTDTQRPLVTGLVELQRKDLEEIVAVRRAISVELRRFMKEESVDQAKVMSLAKRYGELDGEISYCYATRFAEVGKSFALIMHHLDPEGEAKWYWLLDNLPADTRNRRCRHGLACRHSPASAAGGRAHRGQRQTARRGSGSSGSAHGRDSGVAGQSTHAAGEAVTRKRMSEITDHTRVTVESKKGELGFEAKAGKSYGVSCLSTTALFSRTQRRISVSGRWVVPAPERSERARAAS